MLHIIFKVYKHLNTKKTLIMLILYSKFCLGKFFINLIKNSLLIIVKVIVDVSTTLSTELINQIFLINFKLVFNLYILSVSKKSLKPFFHVL